MRADGRANDALRPVTIDRGFSKYAEGSVLIGFGDTRVLCTATLDPHVPPFLRGTGKGWVTAEYAMLPRSTQDRTSRDAAKKGRALEISRLIGRSLRSVMNLEGFGECQCILDCDVIQADGGTRTAAVTGAYVALRDAFDGWVRAGRLERSPVIGQCAGISVGIVEGELRLDLPYEEDVRAEVDLNLVMCANGDLIEVQATAEHKAYSRADLDGMIALGQAGIRELFALQDKALGL